MPGIRVTVGDEVWTTSAKIPLPSTFSDAEYRGHPTAALPYSPQKQKRSVVPAERQSTQVSLPWRDTFRYGLVVGLLLGSLSLIAFHQIPVATSAQDTSAAPKWPTLGAASGPLVTVPSLRFYALQVASFPAAAAAVAAQRALAERGVATVIFPDGHSQLLIDSIALQSSDLKHRQSLLQRQGIHTFVATINQPARSIHGQSDLSAHQAVELSTWLSDEISVLNALTASLADGTSSQDARAAEGPADKVMPATDVLLASGYDTLLAGVAARVQAAVSREGADRKQALRDVESAYSLLAGIDG